MTFYATRSLIEVWMDVRPYFTKTKQVEKVIKDLERLGAIKLVKFEDHHRYHKLPGYAGILAEYLKDKPLLPK